MSYTTLKELNRKFSLNVSEEDENKEEGYYNCMGFALGTYNWDELSVYGYDCCDDEYDYDEMDEVLDEAIDDLLCFSNYICHPCEYNEELDAYIEEEIKYPSIRYLGRYNGSEYDEELKEGEYLVAMRLAEDDFHFARKIGDTWYHKPGWCEIRAMEDEDLDAEENWCNRYYGDIAMFACKEAA